MFWFTKKTNLTLPSRDIHCHLLPGVDDGFKTADESIVAINTMLENGVKEFVFTPHMNPDVYPNESEAHFREVYESFKETLASTLLLRQGESPKGEGVDKTSPSPLGEGLGVRLAAEYMVVKGFEQRAADHADELLTYPDGSILIEMSYMYRSRNFEDAIFELVMAGLKPIVAHPERYLYMVDSLGEIDHWVDMGARLQLNLLSLTGQYGAASVRIMEHLLKHGLYSFVATDLHSNAQLARILETKVDAKLLSQLTCNK